MTVALVTDSTCNLPLDMAAERHIYMAPLYVIWGEKSFRDGIDFTEDEFYRRLAAAKGDAIPKTSQVSPQDFIDLFRRARETEQADEVVCAVISSGLSGTYASAMQAKEAVDFPVHIVDTRQTSWALGHAMLSGADARDNGAGAPDIVRTIEAAANRQNLYFTIESLEYLHRGGRIGNARLLLGSALHVQPVLELKEGIVSSIDNVRTRKRAVVRLIKVAEEAAAGNPALRLSVIHADAEDEAQELLEKASSKIKPKETHLSYATLVIGVHTGPGALGIIIERDIQA